MSFGFVYESLGSPESWLAMWRNFDLWEAKLKTDLSGCVPIKL